ncbi:hypothetical protein DICPUDRAFT_158361 [Dictyostelium purpureum]|uniref:Uncharacterized protein n=1 Tax=Dictyostelium purpureum TaxID=5786 RepID=F1A1F3_DICPU|nr:uncharacterized protein DICPUDRAFT_158361 [Dictyostelium purpureum]EGC29975.1 hypothetical protein DICPUDRAFT_158361 [Dictyostelium purpureum]|eukprot:XP_003293495.1 hypothetical protein DICPUDRAFT_158361 [Dictyostelium purpureum]
MVFINNSSLLFNSIDDSLFKRIPNPNQSQPSIITNSPEKVLIIESYPMVSRIWENLNYSGYLKFRSYIVNKKSKKYISILLLFLVGPFFPYYNINYFDFYENQFNISTPLKSNLDQLNSILPIQNNPQPLDGFISSYDQCMKDRELVFSTYTPSTSWISRVSTNNNLQLSDGFI